MTLRDYFAAQAMQALLKKEPGLRLSHLVLLGIVEDSYTTADAMLDARGEKSTQE